MCYYNIEGEYQAKQVQKVLLNYFLNRKILIKCNTINKTICICLVEPWIHRKIYLTFLYVTSMYQL